MATVSGPGQKQFEFVWKGVYIVRNESSSEARKINYFASPKELSLNLGDVKGQAAAV